MVPSQLLVIHWIKLFLNFFLLLYLFLIPLDLFKVLIYLFIVFILWLLISIVISDWFYLKYWLLFIPVCSLSFPTINPALQFLGPLSDVEFGFNLNLGTGTIGLLIQMWISIRLTNLLIRSYSLTRLFAQRKFLSTYIKM